MCQNTIIRRESNLPLSPHFPLRQVCTSSLSEGSWLWVTKSVCKEGWGTGRVQRETKTALAQVHQLK